MPQIKLNSPLVLASTSTIREQMLRQAGLHFSVITPRCDEDMLKAEAKGLSIPEACLMLARAKAMSVSDIHAGWVVIGGDQMCELEGAILSKPGSPEKAAEQLKRLQNKTHYQHSAGVLVQAGKVIFETVVTAKLIMRSLTQQEIEVYVALDNPIHSCGAYKYESLGKHLFEAIEGNDAVIQGLPFQPLLNALYQHKLITLET
ncbi:MAG: Maf family protein [Rickettsiales bacterium]